jgi:putative transposase
MGYLTDLTDEQWAWVEPIFPSQEGPGRRRTVSLRRVIDALMYQDRTGCQWRLIPLDFPPSGTVRYYFDKWNDDGTMLEIHDCLRRAVRMQQGRESEPTAIVIDSQSVKTAEAGGERGFDCGKHVDGRKRQLVVDTEGNLLTVVVHAANIQDRDGVQPAYDPKGLSCSKKVAIGHRIASRVRLEESMDDTGASCAISGIGRQTCGNTWSIRWCE